MSQVSEHPSVARFAAAWAAAVGEVDVVALPESVHTAALAAQALGCEVGAIANSLLFTTDDERPVLLLTSGAHRVDLVSTAERIGVNTLKRADPAFVKRHSGQVIGGVSPLGHPAPIPTWIDPWLERYPQIWAAAGHPAALFATTYADLTRATGATVVSVEAGE